MKVRVDGASEGVNRQRELVGDKARCLERIGVEGDVGILGLSRAHCVRPYGGGEFVGLGGGG